MQKSQLDIGAAQAHAMAQAQQEKAIQQAKLEGFMFNTISRVYAALVAKYDDNVPVEVLAAKARVYSEALAVSLGLLKVDPPKPEGKVVIDE